MKRFISLISASILVTLSPILSVQSAHATSDTASITRTGNSISTTVSFAQAQVVVARQDAIGSQLRLVRVTVNGWNDPVTGGRFTNAPSKVQDHVLFSGSDLSQGTTLLRSTSGSLPASLRGAYIFVCWEFQTNAYSNVFVCSDSVINPFMTVLSQPLLSLNGSLVSNTNGEFEAGSVFSRIFACPNQVTARTSPSELQLSGCIRLLPAQGSGVPSSLENAVLDSSRAAYNRETHGSVIVLQTGNSIGFVWTAGVNYSGAAPGQSGPSIQTPAPIKYSGPEFSGLSLKPALAGSSATLQGRKLDQISSVTIGGKAAVLSNATDKSVNIGLPAGLAPGVYDLVVTTASHGKLTHMNSIRIREELVPTSLTIQGTGVLSGEEFKKLTAFARTQNPDMNTVTCIVNSGSEGKSFTQVRALCDRIAAANPNIKTTQFETRSTVKSSAVFARVVFSSVQ